MMRLLSRLAVVAGLIVITASPLYAVSLRDLIRLSQSGLGDEVLVALIELDGGPFLLTADQILELRQAGVSEGVIVALIKAAGTRSAPIEPPIPVEAPMVGYAPAPQPQYAEPVPVPVPVPVPYYVPVLVAPTVGIPPGSHRRTDIGPNSSLGDRRFIHTGTHRPPPTTAWQIGQESLRTFLGTNNPPQPSQDARDGQQSRRESNTRRPR